MRPETVGGAAPALRELAALLRGRRPLYARGLAMLGELLSDGTGAFYARPGGTALEHALVEIRAALAGEAGVAVADLPQPVHG